MNYTDTQLKQALAKMLPEDVEVCHDYLMWKRQPTKFHIGPAEDYQIVLDTELLHLCWLVEETLDYAWKDYHEVLIQIMPNGAGAQSMLFHATWQQRTIALAKVKGVDL